MKTAKTSVIPRPSSSSAISNLTFDRKMEGGNSSRTHDTSHCTHCDVSHGMRHEMNSSRLSPFCVFSLKDQRSKLKIVEARIEGGSLGMRSIIRKPSNHLT